MSTIDGKYFRFGKSSVGPGDASVVPGDAYVGPGDAAVGLMRVLCGP